MSSRGASSWHHLMEYCSDIHSQSPPDESHADMEMFRRNYRRNQSQDFRSVPRHIYILGTGSIGKFVAHSLRSLPNPPSVTLYFHTKDRFDAWESSSKEITLTTNGISVSREGFNAEFFRAAFRRHGKQVTFDEYMSDKIAPHLSTEAARQDELPSSVDEGSQNPIHNLIVTVKAPATVGALLNIKHRLLPTSSILFLQNGMGIVDEVSREVFPDPEQRPNYMLGIISHGVNSQGQFAATHAGHGTIQIGLLPRDSPSPTPSPPALPLGQAFVDEQWNPGSRYLLRTMLRSPVLAAVPQTPTEILQAQLEKLAVNAVINPLTALLDARNGAVLYNYAISRCMRLLLAEISLVIRSMPELRGLPNTSTRFSSARLETLAVNVAYRTRNNISSMCADVREGRRTEIDYINGFIVRKGEELGFKCLMNYFVTQLVTGKKNMIDRERNEEVVQLPGTPIGGLFGGNGEDDVQWTPDRQ